MTIGEPITVLEGPYAGFEGRVVYEAGDQLVVELEIFGRATEVTLTHSDVGFRGASLDVLEGKVLDAVSNRGFRPRIFFFWQLQARSGQVRTEEELASAFEAHAQEIIEEQEAAQAEALARFRTAFEPLDAAALDQKWLAERDDWLGWRTQAQAVTDALDQQLLGDLEGDARVDEQNRLHDAAHELRERVERWQRKHGLERAPVPEARNLELELQIEAEVERDEPFLVYADWLLAQGNPRGELILVQATGEARKTAAEALARRLAPQLLGPLARFQLEARWRLGFLERLEVEATRRLEADGVDVVKLLEVALSLQSARFLRELVVACPSAHEAQVIQRLHVVLTAGGVRPTLRKLAFVTNEGEEMLSWTEAGELAGTATLFPNLEELEVHAGSYQLTAPHFPRLQRLTLRTCGMTAENLEAIAAADWPALERLELWVGSASYGVRVTAEQFEPLLQSTRLPRLRSLALCNCELTDTLCASVLASPLLPGLESLSLAKGTMTEAGALLLIDGAQRLRHLELLDVDDNYLSDEIVARLQHVLPQTRSTEQRTPEEYDGQLHRYASVGE